MIKKLTVLMIVVALSSMALARGNVTFNVDVDGSPYNASTNGVYDGALVKVAWNDDSVVLGDTGPSDLQISVSSGAGAGNFWFNQDAPLWGAGLSGWQLDPAFSATTNGAGFDAIISGLYEPINVAIGPPTSGDEFSFEFTAGSDLVIVDASFGSYSSDSQYAVPGNEDLPFYPYAVLTPEPMTIALLGLGGLMLRRRKK